MNREIYFKSFRKGRRGFEILTSDGCGGRQTSQTLKDVLERGVLKPNTTHPAGWERLCTSLISEGYDGSYRPDGLLFTTQNRPDYCIPFDLMALTEVDDFSDSDHEAEFLYGYERFIFDNYSEMHKAFPTHKDVVVALNEFRQSHGLKPVSSDRMRYNEFCFTKGIGIAPLSVVGCSEMIEVGREYSLPGYGSIQQYLSIVNHGGVKEKRF